MKALPVPLFRSEGTANFHYKILLVSFHLQYRDVLIHTHTFRVFFLVTLALLALMYSAYRQWQ